jgi:hypothetical protein
MITSETSAFLNKLWAVIQKHKPHMEDNVDNETVVEDTAYLQEKLSVINNACEVYDRKTIKKALTDLQQKQWSSTTRKLLATMEEDLLNGDFAAIEKTAEEGNVENR